MCSGSLFLRRCAELSGSHLLGKSQGLHLNDSSKVGKLRSGCKIEVQFLFGSADDHLIFCLCPTDGSCLVSIQAQLDEVGVRLRLQQQYSRSTMQSHIVDLVDASRIVCL